MEAIADPRNQCTYKKTCSNAKQKEENKGEWYKHSCSEDGVEKKKVKAKIEETK